MTIFPSRLLETEQMKNNKWKIILLVAIILAGLIIRISLAPRHGFKGDVLLFQVWSYSTVQNGIGHVYNTEIGKTSDNKDIPLPNYLPLYLYFLKASGTVYQLVSPQFLFGLDSALTIILKLNAILFDVLTALAIFVLLKKMTNYWTALLSMSIFYLNPGIIYDSSYWGQVDSIHAFFIILSLYFLTQKKFTGSWIFMTLAMLMKLQSFVILPIVIWVTIKERGWEKILPYIFLGLMIFLAVSFPFLVTGNFDQVLRVIVSSPGNQPSISMNAFNVWWPFTGGNLMAVEDSSTLLGIPYFYLGLVAFCLFYACIILYLRKRSDYRSIFFAASAASFAFFMLPTEMHERYMYPVLPIMAMILWLDKKYRMIFIALSITFFVNLLAVLPFGGLQAIFGTSLPKSLWVVAVNCLVLLYFLYLLITDIKKNSQNDTHEKIITRLADV
jgi:Gpi18-like mannosyltransferase